MLIPHVSTRGYSYTMSDHVMHMRSCCIKHEVPNSNIRLVRVPYGRVRGIDERAMWGLDASHFPDGISFFFFQAEDGIRDWSVTGVQTCALPIWTSATVIM